MNDVFIYRLVSFFTVSIIIWALFAYIELWINCNIRRTAKIISELLRSNSKPSSSDPLDYCIVEGLYKGRKIICRISRFSPSTFLHYNLRLHIHIEPMSNTFSRPTRRFASPEYKPRGKAGKITYDYTSLTATKTYAFSSTITKHEFIQIFEELVRAAETVEA